MAGGQNSKENLFIFFNPAYASYLSYFSKYIQKEQK